MIPTWLQAIILGVVQGLTEFVPVSSSGHLVLLPYLVGWERPGLAFDVALHLGTAGAIVAYFRRELAAMALGLLGRGGDVDARLYRRLAVLVAVATVPVGVAGVLWEDFFEAIFETPLAAASFFLVTAAILYAGEAWRSRRVARGSRGPRAGVGQTPDPAGQIWTGDWVGGPAQTVEETPNLPVGDDPVDPLGRNLAQVGLRHAVAIGLAQLLALFPGVSRSGTTIMAGVGAGLTREAATRFSFLLALPALLGAGLVSARELSQPQIYTGGDIALGVVAAFVSSYAAISFLIGFVSTERLTVFAKYLVAAAIIGFLGYLMIGPPGAA